METLLRQWVMLKNIPAAPKRVTAGELTDRLRAEGIAVTVRTVQRDLVMLSSILPLCSNERGKPFGWSWMAAGSPLLINHVRRIS